MAKNREKTSTVANELRAALLASDKTRYQVSQESGVDQAALHRFVGGGGLRIESLEALARALGLEIRVVRSVGPKKGRKQ